MNLTNRKSYWFRLFVAASLLLNAIFGGRMYESVCARAWRVRRATGVVGWWSTLTIDLMDLLEKDHCKKSAEYYNKLIGAPNDSDNRKRQYL